MVFNYFVGIDDGVNTTMLAVSPQKSTFDINRSVAFLGRLSLTPKDSSHLHMKDAQLNQKKPNPGTSSEMFLSQSTISMPGDSKATCVPGNS